MAYVAITARLQGHIKSKIITLENAEQAGSPPPAPPSFTGEEPWLAARLWGVLHGTPFERHPDLTVHSGRGTYFNIRQLQDDGRHVEAQVTLQCANLPRHSQVDLNGRMNYGYTVEVDASEHPYFGEIIAYNINCKEIAARWEAVQTQVSSFLNACKSLNEALKLWPDLRRYVGAEYLAKVAEKAEKPVKDQSAALARLAAMDMENIAVSNVLARMAGAPAPD